VRQPVLRLGHPGDVELAPVRGGHGSCCGQSRRSRHRRR
jgi:hypothetical protein